MSPLWFVLRLGQRGVVRSTPRAKSPRNGAVIKNVSRVLGKTVKIFEFARDPETVVKNMIPMAKSVEVGNDSVTVTIPNSDRSVVIGRSGRNIKVMKEFLKRHFKINYLRLR